MPGIGKRTAERIIVELREKVAGALEEEVALAAAEGGDARSLARDGLVNLGYAPLEAEQLLDGLDGEEPAGARRRGAAQGRRGEEQGVSESPDIGANRIRTPGIDDEPVPIDAEVRVHDARADVPDEDLDRSLRPPTLADFVNQAQVTEQLAIFIEAARGRGEPLDHVLLAGPPGLGKTSLAHIVAAELGVPMVQTAGPALERKADVASFLTALEPGSVFFIDEIHRLGRAVEETLYPAMEDGELPVVLGQGAGARTVTLPLPPFTLVGATTRSGLLTTPLRDRFGVSHRLEHYSAEHLALIVERSARILEVEIDAEGARDDRRPLARHPAGRQPAAEAGPRLRPGEGQRSDRGRGRRPTRWRCSRSTPAASTAPTAPCSTPSRPSSAAARSASRPWRSRSARSRTRSRTCFEPYLLQQGLLKRTPRGRVLTQRAYDHLGLPAPEGAASLF